MVYDVIYSKIFIKNYTKIKESGNKRVFDALNKSLKNLVNDISNPHDHKLKGKLAKYRACHYDFSEENEEINEKSKNKWVIVYRIENNGDTLYLKTTGTHNVYDEIDDY
jgi:addiction module RelE/StbE family toxin